MALRAVALLLFLVTLVGWLVMGANLGWTKTSVPVKRTDEVTGITVDDYQKRFVPGLEIVGAALLAAGALAAISFCVNCKQPLTTS